MTWIIKVDDDYVQTLWWGVIGPQQSLAVRFDDPKKARRQATRFRWILARDYLGKPPAIRVVKLLPRTPRDKAPGK